MLVAAWSMELDVEILSLATCGGLALGVTVCRLK